MPAASGLCELVQHLSMFDYIAVAGTMENRVTEFVDHLHEHFVDPVTIERARYSAAAARLQLRDQECVACPVTDTRMGRSGVRRA